MNSKHTPGPWHWSHEHQARDLSDTWSLIGSNAYGILSCDGDCNSPQHINKADARLIAAAPDLLNALSVLVKVAEARGIPCDAAHAAIRKARGEA